MAFLTVARLAALLLPQTEERRGTALRLRPERIVLSPRPGLPTSAKAPVRIFLGTEPAQYRAERIFIWSIEQVRDPSRVYEIYLMKNLSGFDRRLWLTGFTNYRFAIPHLAGLQGRAIYNDVDQIYLCDPAELFDADMGEHGFLSISDRDTSVMLIDCARMAPLWTLDAAQKRHRKTLEAKARAVAGLWGQLDPGWNARDEEYQPGRSRLVHYTTLHTQPWRPFPQRFVYRRNPVGQLWFNLERSADQAHYNLFDASHPSSAYTALLERLRTNGGWTEPPAVSEDLQELLTQAGAGSVLHYQPGAAVAEHDALVCRHVLEYLPDEDLPWVIDTLFAHARQLVYAEILDHPHTKPLSNGIRLQSRSRGAAWWCAQFDTVAARHPAVHWKLMLHERNPLGFKSTRLRAGGRLIGDIPSVWVLTQHKPGHSTQSLGLAQALGWPHQIKQLPFTDFGYPLWRLASAFRPAYGSLLRPPWPDLIIATGWLPTRVACWIRRQSGDRTRLVLLGRKAGPPGEMSDIAVSCAHFGLPSHPRRIETLLPLNRIEPKQLAQAAAQRPDLLGAALQPRIVLLVGGSSRSHCLDAKTARRMAAEVRTFAETTGGSAFAVTSRRTGAEATAALERELGARLHAWRPNERDNPYTAYLALADVLIVTGESESMLAEAAATGKPLYIYPIPERRPGPWRRFCQWVAMRAQAQPLNKRGTVRPQQGLEYFCARLVERGFILPPRNLDALHRNLVDAGYARMFGDALELRSHTPLNETLEVARRLHKLLGFTDPDPRLCRRSL